MPRPSHPRLHSKTIARAVDKRGTKTRIVEKITMDVSGVQMARAKNVMDLRALARVHTHTAIRVLAKIATSPRATAGARVAACAVLLDRGWGKVPTTIAGDSEGLRITVRQIIENEPQSNGEDVAVPVSAALIAHARAISEDEDDEGDQ